MKYAVIIISVAFSLSTQAKSLSDTSVSYIEKQMQEGMLEKIQECVKHNSNLCPILLNKETSEVMQDYLELVHNLPSKIIPKKGLIVSLHEVNMCMVKLNKIADAIQVRRVSDDNKIVYTKFFKSSNHRDFTENCLYRKEIAIDFKKFLMYDADIVYPGAPVAMTIENFNEFQEVIDIIKREGKKVRGSNEQLTIRVTASQTVNGLFGKTKKWSTYEIKQQQVIYFAGR